MGLGVGGWPLLNGLLPILLLPALHLAGLAYYLKKQLATTLAPNTPSAQLFAERPLKTLYSGLLVGALLLCFIWVTLAACKVFLLDASALTGLYRVLSFFGLDLVLFFLSWLYSQFVFKNNSPDIDVRIMINSEEDY